MLRVCLVRYYTKKRDVERMEDSVWNEGNKFRRLAKYMDMIGWRRYMEGMISRKILKYKRKI